MLLLASFMRYFILILQSSSIAGSCFTVVQLKPLVMSKLIKSLLVVALSAIMLSACSHTITIEKAASGRAGKCGRNHL
jgi:O-antigen ligase